MERRLSAIFAADVVGYSRLMGIDEAGTLSALKTHRREMADLKIAEHQGRIVKLTGDGMLVEFPSVVNAVACAADIQRRMRERNAGVPEDRRIEFRIGINLGDIIFDDNDIYGDGVNVAARIESVARPGGVAVSGTVRDHIGKNLDLVFEDMGEQVLKNIDRPVRVYNVDLVTDRAGSADRRCSPRPSRRQGKALDRGAAVQQHERRCRAGIFRRRHHRGHHHRSLQDFGPSRARPQHRLYLQGQGREGAGGGGRTRSQVRARRQRAQGRAARTHHRPAHRRQGRRPRLGRPLRPGPDRHLRHPGRDHQDHRRPAQGQASAGGEKHHRAGADGERRGLHFLSSRPRLLPSRLEILLYAGQAHVHQGYRARSALCARLCRHRRLRLFSLPQLR